MPATRAQAQLFQSILPENAVLPTGIAAYQSEPIEPVDRRPVPDSQALGLREGGFILYPSLTEGFGYDSKIVATSGGPGSVEVLSQPSVLLQSDWSRHSLTAQVGVSDTRFPQLPGQSYTDYTIALGGRYDLGSDALSVAASRLGLNLLPTDVTAGTLLRPEAFTINDVRVGYLASFGRLTLQPHIDVSHTTYSNTEENGVPQDTLDHTSYQFEVRTSYELATDRAVLVDLSAIDQHFPNAVPTLNQNGWRALAGSRDRTGPFTFFGLVGFEQRYFASSAYHAHGAPVAELGVEWSPTLLTSLTLRAERAIEDTSNTASSGYTSDVASLQVDHEYSYLTRLSAELRYTRIASLDSSEIGTLYEADASVTQALDRTVSLKLDYDFSIRTDNLLPNNNFTRHAVLLKVLVAP